MNHRRPPASSGVLALSCILTASCGSSGPSKTPTSPGPSGSGTVVVNALAGLFPGDSAQATASVVTTENGLLVSRPTSQATWVSSDASIATITSGGMLTAVAPGTARLTATYQGVSGSGVVTVLAEADLVGLEVSCPSTLMVGQSLLCTAAGRLRSGGLVQPRPAWSSTRPEVVTIDAVGIVSARAAGQAVITATYRTQSGSAQISVTAEDALRVTSAA